MNKTPPTASPLQRPCFYTRQRPKIGWLQGSPACRSEGPIVYVTLALDPGVVTAPACLAWSTHGLHATTPRIIGESVTCGIPRGIFEHRARVTLQILDCGALEKPVYPWTQIPVLREAVFRADMAAGDPILVPLAAQRR